MLKQIVRIGNLIIDTSDGLWMYAIGGGKGTTTTETLGFTELPQEIQDLATSQAGFLSSIGGDSSVIGSSQSNLNALTDWDNFSNQYNYLNDVVSGKYLDFSTNPAYQSLANEYGETLDQKLGGLRSDINNAGQFFSSYGGNAQGALTDSLTEDFLNQLGDLYTTERGYQQDAVTGMSDLYSSIAALNEGNINSQMLGSNSINSLITAMMGGSNISTTDGSSLK